MFDEYLELVAEQEVVDEVLRDDEEPLTLQARRIAREVLREIEANIKDVVEFHLYLLEPVAA